MKRYYVNQVSVNLLPFTTGYGFAKAAGHVNGNYLDNKAYEDLGAPLEIVSIGQLHRRLKRKKKGESAEIFLSPAIAEWKAQLDREYPVAKIEVYAP